VKEQQLNKLSYRRDSAGRQSLRRLAIHGHIDFDTNGKPVWDLLLYSE